MKSKKNGLDIILNALCLAVLVGMSACLVLRWGRIPELVPEHYDASGAADRYGPKGELIWLALGAWGFFALLTAAQFIPKSMWNAGFAATPEEREQVFTLCGHLLGCGKLAITLLLACCTVAPAEGARFPVWCALALIAAALGSILYWIGRIVKVGKR